MTKTTKKLENVKKISISFRVFVLSSKQIAFKMVIKSTYVF